MRAWYMQNMSVGLLYTCALGDVRPDCPVALIQNRKHEGADFMEVIPMEHQMPAQREQVHAFSPFGQDAHANLMEVRCMITCLCSTSKYPSKQGVKLLLPNPKLS